MFVTCERELHIAAISRQYGGAPSRRSAFSTCRDCSVRGPPIEWSTRAAGRRLHGEVALPDPSRVALFGRVSSYMAAHAFDPDVTPTSAAQQHNVSIRPLPNIFAECGGSPTRYFRQCKVERAATSLSGEKSLGKQHTGVE